MLRKIRWEYQDGNASNTLKHTLLCCSSSNNNLKLVVKEAGWKKNETLWSDIDTDGRLGTGILTAQSD